MISINTKSRRRLLGYRFPIDSHLDVTEITVSLQIGPYTAFEEDGAPRLAIHFLESD